MRSAIYARQSADRKDSISIESQIEDCRTIAGDSPYIFSDRGYSGANLQRPAFCELMEHVDEGTIDRIYIYRLDRISRSLPDFVSLTEKLRKHGVTLISKSEGFDTSSETSLILLNILMMFAQMERGAISQRVRDNYHSRGKKGLYLGGYPPFGYDKKPITVGKIHTSCYVKNKNSELVEQIYKQYTAGGSYTGIAASLNDLGIRTSKGKSWTAGAIKRIIKSPVYAMADGAVYRYLKACGAVIHSPTDEFDGRHGCLCFGTPSARHGAKFSTLDGENIVIGFHEGIIPSSVWLSAQRKNVTPDYSRGGVSFLQGLMKCSCGYSLYTKSYRERKYLCCHGRRLHICDVRHIVTCDELEHILTPLICNRLDFLSGFSVSQPDSITQQELISLDEQYSRLLGLLSQSGDDEAVLIRRELDCISLRRREILFHRKTKPPKEIHFPSLSFSEKKSVCRQVIDRIEISGEEITVVWI